MTDSAKGITKGVLGPPSLAGFEVSIYGRISGVHRGSTFRSCRHYLELLSLSLRRRSKCPNDSVEAISTHHKALATLARYVEYSSYSCQNCLLAVRARSAQLYDEPSGSQCSRDGHAIAN